MTLFATRPITDGEEITIEYTKLTESRETRRGRLFDMYHFHCECEYCNVSKDKAAASDAARQELREWPETSFRSPIEWCKNMSLPDDYLVEGHTRCITLHEQEGIIDMDYAMHIGELAFVYGMLADKNFGPCGRKALEVLGMMGASEKLPWKSWLENPKQNFGPWGMRIAQKARR
jgi:hypothetical protein